MPVDNLLGLKPGTTQHVPNGVFCAVHEFRTQLNDQVASATAYCMTTSTRSVSRFKDND
jgi:hypothetical protein